MCALVILGKQCNHLLKKYFLSAYFVPDSSRAGDTAVNKPDKNSCPLHSKGRSKLGCHYLVVEQKVRETPCPLNRLDLLLA